MSSVEFGVHATDGRIQAASESVNDSFLYRAFDIDERWDERIKMFPEFAPAIEKLRTILRRRQAKFTSEDFQKEGKKHLDISHFVHEQTGIPHLLMTEVLLNRSFGETLPDDLDMESKDRITKIADEMIVESNGIVLKSDNHSVTKFIAMVLTGEVGIDYQEYLGEVSPGQMDFDLI